MAEASENPSKRRKLDAPEHSTDLDEAVISPPLERTNGSSHSQTEIPENGAQDQSKVEVPEPGTEEPPLSKNQLKKRRRQEQWEAGVEDRKLKRRDKRHERQARKAQGKAELQDKIAKGEIEIPKVSPEEAARKRMRPEQVPVTLLVDCDFEDFMLEKEIISMGSQLTRCYSDNRRSRYRAHLAISSWGGVLKTRFETVLVNAHKSWNGVVFTEKNFVEAAKDTDILMRSNDGGKLLGAFAPSKVVGGDGNEEDILQSSPDPENGKPATQEQALRDDQFTQEISVEFSDKPDSKEEDKPQNASNAPQTTDQPPSLVYLTSDSPHTLDRLSPYTSYIIGGIVDKNRHKGLCYKRACERGIPTAKLPIGEYMTMQSRTVLTVNHVVEIMLQWLETGDWGEAFLRVIPKRKEAKLKVKKGDQDGDEDGKDSASEHEFAGTPLEDIK